MNMKLILIRMLRFSGRNAESRARSRRSILRSDAGTSLLEMALITPLLCLLLIGIIEIGRYAYLSILTANAARAGVAYGAQNLGTAMDITGMQNAALADGQNIPGLTATASYFCQCADGSASTCLATDCAASHRLVYVQVNTAGTFSSIFNYPGIPQTFNVNGIAVMRVAQ
jgi:Flp pilus assembly protein TadG